MTPGINVWAFIALLVAIVLFVAEWLRGPRTLTALGWAFLAGGVLLAFFLAGHEPLLHP